MLFLVSTLSFGESSDLLVSSSIFVVTPPVPAPRSDALLLPLLQATEKQTIADNNISDLTNKITPKVGSIVWNGSSA